MSIRLTAAIIQVGIERYCEMAASGNAMSFPKGADAHTICGVLKALLRARDLPLGPEYATKLLKILPSTDGLLDIMFVLKLKVRACHI